MPLHDSFWNKITRSFRVLFHRDKLETELNSELRFHLEAQVESKIRGGMSPDAARQSALREFGGVELAKEECRDERGAHFLEQMWQDLCFGARMLRKNPGFTIVAVLTLALGIGATTAIFSVVNAVLLRPLPYTDTSRIVQIQNTYASASVANFPKVGLSPGDFADWRANARLLLDMAAYSTISQGFNLTGQTDPQRVRAAYAGSNLFSMLGVHLIAGRDFIPEEDKFGGGRSVILSHGLWQSRFGADPSVIGHIIDLDGAGYTMAGVLPASFPLVRGADIWLPIGQFPDNLTSRVHHDFTTLARLKPGVSLVQAQQEIESLNRQAMHDFPDTHKNFGIDVALLQDPAAEKMRTPLLVLMGVVSFVLLIACANIVNLLLARNAVRRRETALRAALGASRWRLVRQQLTESVLLAFIGGTVGLGLAWGGFQILGRLAPPELASVKEAGLHGSVLAFTFGICFLAGLISGVLPAFRSVKTDLNSVLKEESRSSASGSSQRLQGVLVVSQIALALIPLISAGLLVRSFQRLMSVDPGFRADHVLVMNVTQPNLTTEVASKMTNAQFIDLSRRQGLEFEQTAGRIQNLPGVQSVGGIDFLPLASGLQSASRFLIEGQPVPDAGVRPVGQTRTASLNYFVAMKIPLIQGRLFVQTDGTETNIIINETMARRFFPNGDALGKRVNLCTLAAQPCWNSIVGVVGDVSQFNLDAAQTYDIYFTAGWPSHFVIRTASDPAALTTAAAGEIHRGNPTLPVTEVRTLDDLLSSSVAPRHFSMLLLMIFAVMALLLAAVGIYGVMSYAVSQRTREIGVRMALGAQQNDVVRMVVGRGARLTFAGIILGLAGAFAITRWLGSLLYRVRPTDSVTFLGVPIIFILVALLACWIPARRAARVDPMRALRNE
jgi:predicted permease